MTGSRAAISTAIGTGKMVLEDEQYIDANFKEFRTPS